MFDLSDEATGLPPLREVAPEDSIMALQWQLGTEGIVTLEGESTPVRYLSVRGLQLDEDGEAFYTQVHIALPHDLIAPMLEAWRSQLEEDDAPSTSHE